jgi:hypothetical protein
MMASGFKPVGWVAAVAASAIGCYMLSLNVASERADLLRVEQQIVATKQDIRTLQTELGTRGRLAQLEQWNADVLALSAPSTGQFLDNEVKLARFEQRAPTLEERGEVRMASAPVVAAPARKIEAPVMQASVHEAPPAPRNPLVHQASLTMAAPKFQKAAAVSVEPVKPFKAAASLPVPVKSIKYASADFSPARPVKPEAKSASHIDFSLTQQIAAAAKLESSRKAR